MANKLNWSTDHAQITDEIINRSASTASGLFHDMFYNKTLKPVVVSTGAGGSGTVLTEDTDYSINGQVTSFPANITDPSPDEVWSTIAIINAAYLDTDLYVSYYPLGDLVEAADINFSQQEISASGALTFDSFQNIVRCDVSGGDITISQLPEPKFIGQTVDFFADGDNIVTITGGTGIYTNNIYLTENCGRLRVVGVDSDGAGTLEWRAESMISADYTSGDDHVLTWANGYMRIIAYVSGTTDSSDTDVYGTTSGTSYYLAVTDATYSVDFADVPELIGAQTTNTSIAGRAIRVSGITATSYDYRLWTPASGQNIEGYITFEGYTA
jgi:hypothetical protein